MGKIEINENFNERGTEILRCRIRLFYPDNIGEGIGTVGIIEDFYRELCDNSYAYAKKELLEKAKSEYFSDNRESKRYRFAPFVYRLSGEVTFDGDCVFSQHIEMKFSHGREILSIFKDGHVWQKNKGLLLPPKEVLKKYGTPDTKKLKFDSVAVLSSGVEILHAGEWKSFTVC